MQVQAMPIDDVDFEMLEDAAEALALTPVHCVYTV